VRGNTSTLQAEARFDDRDDAIASNIPLEDGDDVHILRPLRPIDPSRCSCAASLFKGAYLQRGARTSSGVRTHSRSVFGKAKADSSRVLAAMDRNQ